MNLPAASRSSSATCSSNLLEVDRVTLRKADNSFSLPQLSPLTRVKSTKTVSRAALSRIDPAVRNHHSFQEKQPLFSYLSDLSVSMIGTIDKFFNKQKRSYTDLSLLHLEEINETYYSLLIQEKVVGRKGLEFLSWKFVQEKMQSTQNPIINLILLNLQYYQDRVEATKKVEKPDLLLFTKIFKTIEALLIKDTDYFSLPHQLSSAEFLYQAFHSLDLEKKQLISYLIFGNQADQLDSLRRLLGKCIVILPEKIAIDREKLEHHKIHQFSLPSNFDFEEETITRCFIPNNVILPQCVLINNKPINLNQFTGTSKENFFNFFRYFFKEKIFTDEEENTDNLLNTFYEKNKLPSKYKNLLGISTVSMRLLAYECLDQNYPLLKNSEITYRPQSNVKIFYTINKHRISCMQPLSIIVYPKVDLDDPKSFSIDKKRPLAQLSFILTSDLNKNGKSTQNSLQLQNLSFVFQKNHEYASVSEQNLIKRALNLKKARISNRLRDKLNAFLTTSS